MAQILAVNRPVPKIAETAVFQMIGDVDIQSARRVCAGVSAALKAGATAITLALSSQGGDVGVGLALYAFLRSLPVPLVTHNIGEVSSIALIVYLAGEHRLAVPCATFFDHPGRLHMPGGLVDASLLRAALTKLESGHARTGEILRERTTMPAELIERRALADVTFGTAEALAWRVAHEVRPLEWAGSVHAV